MCTLPQSQDPTCRFCKLPHPHLIPITARFHCTACMFVQRQNLITSSKEQWEHRGAVAARDVHLKSSGFIDLKNPHGFIMSKSSTELFNRKKSGSILWPSSRLKLNLMLETSTKYSHQKVFESLDFK